MSVILTYEAKATVAETLENTPGAPNASKVVTHTNYNISATLNSGTTPPVTKVAQFLLTLTAGAATIDLRALFGTNGAIIDGNGLKVQVLRIKNLGANIMTFSEGASNGYALPCGEKIVQPGGHSMDYFNDSGPDIAAADKTIDVAGTGAQTAEVTIIMG